MSTEIELAKNRPRVLLSLAEARKGKAHAVIVTTSGSRLCSRLSAALLRSACCSFCRSADGVSPALLDCWAVSRGATQRPAPAQPAKRQSNARFQSQKPAVPTYQSIQQTHHPCRAPARARDGRRPPISRASRETARPRP